MNVAFIALVLLLAIAFVAFGLVLFSAIIARRVETALPPLGDYLDVPGARIHYVDKGAGPPLVMIHGLAGQMRHFTHSMLDRLVGEFRVIVIDRPGSGYSVRSRGASARLGAQAASVAAVIRALELERPLLVGHSLGGAVALATALDHPQLVGGLALIAPVTQVQETPPPAFERLVIASPFVRRLVAWTVATPVGIRTGLTVLPTIFAPDPVPRDFATRGGALLGLRPKAFYETSADLVAVNDDLRGMVARYASLRMPVGILFGRDDGILDPAVHGPPTAAAIDGAVLEWTDGGHMLPFTAPDRAASFVREVARRIR